jgi:hypothetical protein
VHPHLDPRILAVVATSQFKYGPVSPIAMQRDSEEHPQSDERGAEPVPDEGSEEDGPMGNPATDEEALSHSQQEQDPPDDD